MTLMLEPPPRTFPMFMGIARPFKLGLGCALKSQSRSEPRLRISHQAGQGFRGKLDKDFAASWTGFSHEAGHGFHGKLDSDFAPSWTVSL